MRHAPVMSIIERLLWLGGMLSMSIFLGHLALAEMQRVNDLAAYQSQPDQSLWSPARIEAFNASLGADTSDVVGVFRIPRLDLEVPIYHGASDLHLDRGIAVIEGTALPGEAGNMGIAGHRDGYFRVLKDIEHGDEVQVSTHDGDHLYRVEKTMIVEPSAVEVLAPTDSPSVTLVTCYPFYFVGHAPQRFIVRAVRQESGEN
jgi:sortase A